MGYEKLAEGMSEREARKRIERVMPSRVKKENFKASTSNVFIGSSNPSKSVGVLSPSHPGNPELLDNPKAWYEKGMGIERIASLRTSLINSKSDSVGEKKEVAMAEKPVDVEIELDRKPSNRGIAGRVKPVSNSAEMKDMILEENPSVNKDIEKAFYDTDLKAERAVTNLSEENDVYSIQKAFSTGLLGEEDNRRIVPTRWSITAVDDQVSKRKRSRVKDCQELGEKLYFRNSYLGNDFHIFLIPGRWEYELIELKRPNSTWNATDRSFIRQNYEPFNGRTSYADECSGAYYAARLAALEYLENIQRQAKVLIVRDVRPDYWAPLGVWVIRETMRNAFEEAGKLEEKKIEDKLSDHFRLQLPNIVDSSKLIGSTQRSLSSL